MRGDEDLPSKDLGMALLYRLTLLVRRLELALLPQCSLTRQAFRVEGLGFSNWNSLGSLTQQGFRV